MSLDNVEDYGYNWVEGMECNHIVLPPEPVTIERIQRKLRREAMYSNKLWPRLKRFWKAHVG